MHSSSSSSSSSSRVVIVVVVVVVNVVADATAVWKTETVIAWLEMQFFKSMLLLVTTYTNTGHVYSACSMTRRMHCTATVDSFATSLCLDLLKNCEGYDKE